MDAAAEAAWQAGRITLRYFQSGVAVETKSDATPVTVADREAERFLSEFLRERFPGDAVFGEEFGEIEGTSGYRWLVDPIDGTKSFVQGVPLYGVMVGLENPDGEAVVGAIAFPPLGELVVGARGLGAFWNGRRARVSETSELRDAAVVFTGLECFDMTETQDALVRVRSAVRITRSWGDCYGHMLVATGRADAMLDPILADWDCAALQPIVEGAGGVLTDWSGRRTTHGKSAVSTNAALADELRTLLGDASS